MEWNLHFKKFIAIYGHLFLSGWFQCRWDVLNQDWNISSLLALIRIANLKALKNMFNCVYILHCIMLSKCLHKQINWQSLKLISKKITHMNIYKRYSQQLTHFGCSTFYKSLQFMQRSSDGARICPPPTSHIKSTTWNTHPEKALSEKNHQHVSPATQDEYIHAFGTHHCGLLLPKTAE